MAELVIGDVFRNAARAAPGRVAAAFQGGALTFGSLDRSANRVARALQGLDVGYGDRVVVWASTGLDVLAVFVALAKVGAVFVPINPALSADEARALALAARPALVVTDLERAAAGAVLVKALSMPGDVAVLNGLATPDALPDVSGGHALVNLAAGVDDADVVAPNLAERDAHVIFFTSGSTGRPHGVVLSHRVNMLRSHPGALLEPRGPMICPYPLFHMGGWTIALQQWQARDRVVFVAPTGHDICAAIEEHRATRLNCIPGVWRRVLEALREAPYDVSSLRFADTGTSATPVSLLTAIEAAFPAAHIRVFYGSTESGGVTMLDHADISRKPGSCGVPAPLSEVRLDGGELLVRGPLVFDGYFDDPALTAARFTDGWYRSGDLAEIDEEGYVSIVGRAGDLIRSGGETVAPTEVEQALADHPAIGDVAVVGLPDERWGEVVCAAVVVRAGCVLPRVDELRRHAEGRLATHKLPRSVVCVEAIPRTSATHQVQRHLLVELIQAGVAPAPAPADP